MPKQTSKNSTSSKTAWPADKDPNCRRGTGKRYRSKAGIVHYFSHRRTLKSGIQSFICRGCARKGRSRVVHISADGAFFLEDPQNLVHSCGESNSAAPSPKRVPSRRVSPNRHRQDVFLPPPVPQLKLVNSLVVPATKDGKPPTATPSTQVQITPPPAVTVAAPVVPPVIVNTAAAVHNPEVKPGVAEQPAYTFVPDQPQVASTSTAVADNEPEDVKPHVGRGHPFRDLRWTELATFQNMLRGLDPRHATQIHRRLVSFVNTDLAQYKLSKK